MTTASDYAALKAIRERIYNLEHVQAIATWDRLTYMPAGSAAARAAGQGELAALIQRMQVDPALDSLIAGASEEALDEDDRKNLELMRRERLIAQAIPEELLVRQTKATSAASEAWAAARANNDWPLFAEALKPLVECVREGARRTGDTLGLSAYDALLDGFDRGLRLTTVQALFDDVASWLPELVRSTLARQVAEGAPIEPLGPFANEPQRELSAKVMEALGFDFTCGRLDVSLHPFTGGTSDDVRLTTRYRQDECLGALIGVIHETGHGLYQNGLPANWRGQPLGEPCSAAMHEAQALTFERQLALTPEFIGLLSKLLGRGLGEQPAFAPDNLQRLLMRVRPGRIRVEADALTYPAHVILRSEIEAALIESEISVDDIPAMWDERMRHLLGIDTVGDFTGGPLQDVHWSQGMFGYFPAYLLGMIVAAQLFETYSEERRAAGANDGENFAPLREWLRDRIWSQGARFTTDELVRAATGRPISSSALHAQYLRRYQGAGESRP